MKELKMEMNVGYLRKLIEELPDNMPVFVACAGLCNYDFEKQEPESGNDTFAIEHDGKLFITDACVVEDGAGNTI